MSGETTRRRYVVALGTVGTVGLAGCAESESDGTETDEAETDTAAGGTPTVTDSGSAGASAAATAEATLGQYLEAYLSGDAETTESLAHPESPRGAEPNPAEWTVTEIAATTLSSVAEDASTEPTDADIQAAREAIEAVVADIGAEAYAVVGFTIQIPESDAASGSALLVRDDGEWYFYEFDLRNYLDEASESETAAGDRVTNRLQVVSAVGTDISDGTIGSVELVVKRAPGADDIDLSRTLIQFVHSSGSTDLTFGAAESAFRFGVQSIQDAGETSLQGEAPTLDDPADRAKLVVDTSAGAVTDGALTEGDTASLQIITQSGGTTEARLVVPETLSDADAVSL
ncbi:hypothetical protein [Haloarcula onubensis]|uniref:Uncharacterized protein n=1 Tax=Haloarcula onubensis TaxID=2950539 RepID=A0ABU2FP70_9EURY|nr:hypothetical protein [Halomicroarcula sp. S3CR25-11]MDS0282556.1 hypothetical protein [Halomicroarcula sp. S3CR25-11]